MSVLRSTYLEEFPDRDRWGHAIHETRTVSVHVATTGWDHIHIQLEEVNDDQSHAVEVNMTIVEALQVAAAIVEAIQGAMKGVAR